MNRKQMSSDRERQANNNNQQRTPEMIHEQIVHTLKIVAKPGGHY